MRYNKIPSKRRSARIESGFFALDINYIESLLVQLQFNKAIELGETITKKYINNNWIEPYGLMHLNYYIALSYFYTENYKQALKWINKIASFEGNEQNLLIVICKTLQIIIHYELQNNDLVLSLAQSLIKKLKKVKKLGEFENSFLNFCINKLSSINNKIEEKKVFIAYRTQLKSGSRNQIVKNEGSIFFDFNAWLDFKINKRPFVNILREKTMKRQV